MIRVGTKLLYLREKAGLSLAAAARELGMSKSYLWQLEHENRKAPSSDLLYKISIVFGVNMEWFYDADLFCRRCGHAVGDSTHYLTEELPYVCDSCFKEGQILLRAQANAMNRWIEQGENNSKIGGEET